MRILSINSGASGRSAAFIDKDGKVKVRKFPIDATDDQIKLEIDNEVKFGEPICKCNPPCKFELGVSGVSINPDEIGKSKTGKTKGKDKKQ
jgi:hypothetical protein